MKEDHVRTTFQTTSTFIKMDEFSESVYETWKTMLYAQVRTPFGKDPPTHFFRNLNGIYAEVWEKTYGENPPM